MPAQYERPARRETTGMTTKARIRAAGRTSLRATIRNVQTRNADVDPDEVQSLIDEELALVRASFWTQTHK